MNRVSSSSDASTIKKRSGWLIPLIVFVATAALSALLMLYYLSPGPPSFVRETPSPTADTGIVHLSIGAIALRIPANYIVFASGRNGGARSDVALYALLPDLKGFTHARAQSFSSNAPDSRVVYMLLREDHLNLSEAERFQRIYLSYVTSPIGAPGPFGLTQYKFRDDSGYRGEDLFVGQTSGGKVLLRCVRFSDTVPSPSCLREMPLMSGIALSYRFKRAQLSQWAAIGSGVEALVRSFAKP